MLLPIPFDLDWLSEKFGLIRSAVKSTEFDYQFGCYKIKFNNKEHAEAFYNEIRKTHCGGINYWDFDVSVDISYDARHRILLNAKTSDIGIFPYNLNFFEKYFDLNKNLVSTVFHGIQYYEIHFHDRKDAENFHKKLKEAGCYPVMEAGRYLCVLFNRNMVAFNLLKAARRIEELRSLEGIDEGCATGSNSFRVETLIDQPESFYLEWLVKNLNLDRQFILRAGFEERIPYNYVLKFKDDCKLQAKEFHNKLVMKEKADCWYFNSNNSVVISKLSINNLFLITESESVVEASSSTVEPSSEEIHLEKNHLEHFVDDDEEVALLKKPHNIRVATYNILTSFAYRPKENDTQENYQLSWAFRKDLIVEVLRKINADVIGLQEVRLEQLNYLKENLPEFGMVGFIERTGQSIDELTTDEYLGEIVPILYNKAVLECLSAKVFWLSSTPEQPSTGWDASRPRILTAAVFQNKITGEKLVVGNTHYDHLGDEALVNSGRAEVALLESFRTEHNASDILYLGDRNCFTDRGRHGEEWYRNFLQESQAKDTRDCGKHIGVGTTFFGYKPDAFKAPYNRDSEQFEPNTLDLIFHKEGAYKVRNSKTIAGEYEVDGSKHPHVLPFFRKIESPEERRFISDHALVVTDLKPRR